ncbi:MAG: leucine-rich repeat protein [Clostridiales bacterium]|nr:leucine-rich repeat protein [Clostridiales bacterium]
MDKKLKKIILLTVAVFTLILTLSACRTQVTVSFETFGGSPVASITINKNSLLSERDIPVPQLGDHTFAGWYKDKNFSKEWSFPSEKVKRNTTLYAKFVPVASSFVFTDNGDNTYTVSASTGGISSVIVIPSTYIGKPVTAIADKGFAGAGITKVTIPASIKKIGSEAFKNCSYLNTINFEDGSQLTEIGSYAFSDCKLFTSITIPSSVTTIGTYAFYNDTALRSVTFASGSNLQAISERAFYSCTFLESIGEWNGESIGAMPKSLETIGNYAFYNDSFLKNIYFESNSSLKTIGDHAFDRCAFSSIFIPKTLVTLGSYSFAENNALKDVIFEDGETALSTIASYSFNNCRSLRSIDLPQNITSINSNAFAGTVSLKKIIIRSSVLIGTYGSLTESKVLDSSKAAAVFVPAEIIEDYKSNANNKAYAKYFAALDNSVSDDAESYSEVVDGKFLVNFVKNDDNSITKTLLVYFGTDADLTISIPSLNRIEKHCFSGSPTLESVTIIGSIDYSIGVSAFNNCANLRTLNVDGVKSIDESAFSQAGIKNIFLGDRLEKISMSAFQDCRQLESITIPSSVTSIEKSAFSGCDALVTVNILGNNLLSILSNAFHNDKSLASINLPSSVAIIESSAFWNCSSLAHIALPSSLTEITSLSFAGTALTGITIPASVKTVKNEAFLGCSALAYITFENGSVLESIGDKAFALSETRSLNLNRAEVNANLHSIIFPASLKTIGAGAFYRCYIKVMTINSKINETDGAPDLSALLKLNDNTTLNGRVFIINDTEASSLFASYKQQESYASNDLVVSKESVSPDGKKIQKTESGLNILVAYFGDEAAPSLAGYNTIGKYAFAYNTKIYDIYIPNSIGSIQDGAFDTCINLENIEFQENIVNSYGLGKYTFRNCLKAGLKSSGSIVILRANITYVDSYAFYGWTASQAIRIIGITKEYANSQWAPKWGLHDGNCFADIKFEA